MAGQESLLRAAISAACRERAPRRTIAAIAAAVTTALVTAAASHAKDPKEPTGNLAPNGVQEGAMSGTRDKLEQDLRAARAAKRRLKRQRKRQADRVAKAETLEVTGTIANTRPIAKTWEEAAQIALAAAGKRKAEDDLDAEESGTSMSMDTVGTRRPVVDPIFLTRLHNGRVDDSHMTRPSLSSRDGRAAEGKGSKGTKVQDVDGGCKQPTRRRPP